MRRVAPDYPQRDWMSNRGGVVTLSCVLKASGACEDIRKHEDSNGSIEMVRSATAALKHWRFQPQMHEGGAIETPMLVPFEFIMVQGAAYKDVLARDEAARMQAARSMTESTHRPQDSLGGPQRISGGTFLNEGW